jgi:uncharacterized protein
VVTFLGFEVPIATSFRARLLGLAHLDRRHAGIGLLIPHCHSVHTFGMRFALDLVFLDEVGWPLAIRRGVTPRRFASDRSADAVLELPAGSRSESFVPAKCDLEGGEFLSLGPQ